MDRFNRAYSSKPRRRSRSRDDHRRRRSASNDNQGRNIKTKRSPSSGSSSQSKSSSLYSSDKEKDVIVNTTTAPDKEHPPTKGEWITNRQEFQDRNHQQQANAGESFEQWKVKEDEFHLEQAILRSKIRIESNREKPIDFLAKVILVIEGKL